MNPDEIRKRAAAIRLPVKVLAEIAGIHEDSAHRVLKGAVDPRTSTVGKLSDGLLEEERRMRAHLQDVAEGEPS